MGLDLPDRITEVDRDFDVVPVSLIDNGSDLVIGDGLHVTPSRVGDLDQIDTTPALSAGLADELVARIAHTPAVSAGVPSKPGYGSGSKMLP